MGWLFSDPEPADKGKADKIKAAREASKKEAIRHAKAEQIKKEKADRRAVKAGSKVGNKKQTTQGGMTKKGGWW